MLLSNIEYLSLRLIRRFCFNSSFLDKYGSIIPYYKSNFNKIDPTQIISSYKQFLDLANIDYRSVSSILEIGVGSTNASGYEMALHGFAKDGRITLFEPYAEFENELDKELLKKANLCNRIAGKILRIKDIINIESSSVDLVLSYSVLEHVTDFCGLMSQLKRVMKPNSVMMHVIDYRDHFFKYPYHFLQFSDKTWEDYLNPGDLPRWRLSDHLKLLSDLNLLVEVLYSDIDESAATKIRSHINPRFKDYDESLFVTRSVLLLRK
jgi:SAM-dependent methyltransferase